MSRECTWFVEPLDPSTNAFLAERVDEENTAILPDGRMVWVVEHRLISVMKGARRGANPIHYNFNVWRRRGSNPNSPPEKVPFH